MTFLTKMLYKEATIFRKLLEGLESSWLLKLMPMASVQS